MASSTGYVAIKNREKMHVYAVWFLVLLCTGNGEAGENYIEAIVGQPTSIACGTHTALEWYFLPAGSNPHDTNDAYIYSTGKIAKRFRDRFSVGNNGATLSISTVRMNDSGRYDCIGNNKRSSTQLIVLDSNPEWHPSSNIRPDGLIGPNSCGIEPDVLELSCTVAYRGNASPILKWVMVDGDDKTTVVSVCNSTLGSPFTCVLTMKADMSMNGRSFVCQTTRAVAEQYGCSSGNVKILHALSNNVSLQVNDTQPPGSIVCSANSSQNCTYRWRWFKDDDVLTQSNTSVLIPTMPGLHRCEATCQLAGRDCRFTAMIANVSERSQSSTSEKQSRDKECHSEKADHTLTYVLAGTSIVLAAAVTGLLLYRKRHQTLQSSRHEMSQLQGTQDENDDESREETQHQDGDESREETQYRDGDKGLSIQHRNSRRSSCS